MKVDLQKYLSNVNDIKKPAEKDLRSIVDEINKKQNDLAFLLDKDLASPLFL